MLAFGAFLVPTATCETKVLSICEMFQNLSRFDGQTVSVRGVYDKETHGAALTGESCSSDTKYVIPGKQPSVWLALPEQASGVGARSPAYKIDQQGFRELERLARLTTAIDGKPTITVVGQLTFFKNFELKRMPDASYVGNGFGPYGLHPAVIVIRTVKDVVLTKPGRE